MKKDKHIHIRASDEDRMKLKALAEKLECSASKAILIAIGFLYDIFVNS